MHLAQAMGEPCCNCGSREIIVEPAHLLGACARCSPAVSEERRWNDRVAKAAQGRDDLSVGALDLAAFSAVAWDAGTPLPRKRFGRLPPRKAPFPAPSRPAKAQLDFPGI